MNIIITSVNTEHVAKGKTGYDVATIAYSYQGQEKTTKILSFVQPSLFARVSELESGISYNVTLEQDGKYMRWSQWERLDAGAATAPKSLATPAPKGSWETSEERASKQVLIVKQSSLAQAVAYTKGEELDINEIINVAQKFTDWVLDNE